MDTKKRTRKTKSKNIEITPEIITETQEHPNILESTNVNQTNVNQTNVNQSNVSIDETIIIPDNFEISYDYLNNFKDNINTLIISLETTIKESNRNIVNNSMNNSQTVDSLNKKIKNIQELHKKEVLDLDKSLTTIINNTNSEKNLLICDNIKLKDRILVLENINKQTQEELEVTSAKNTNLKLQFDTYKTESTNTYTNLKGLYDELKTENNVFVNKIDKITKEYDNTKNEFKKFREEYNERFEKDIQSFKNVSLLNTYLKEIDSLKNEISILNQKLTTNKKILERSHKDNKNLSNKLDTLSIIEPNVQGGVEQHIVVEVVEQVEEVLEEEVEEEEAVEVKEVVEEVEEIDVSKLDIIEVDDKEYYVDLDNNIYDKESLDIVGKITEDGDANFFE